MGRWMVWVWLAVAVVPLYGQRAGNWKMVVDLEGRWLFSIGDNARWADPAFNHRSWETILVPSKWEDQGFNGYDGYAWYRNTFDGTLLKNQQLSYTLILGYIDDVDEVFVNGVKIGSSGSFPPRFHTAYNARRMYNIPREAIRFDGKNVIAVRVYDAGIEGGIVKGDVGIYVDEDAKAFAVNLNGVWDFATERRQIAMREVQRRDDRTPSTDASWTTLNVPAPWEHQGFEHFDGTGWYRKQFFVPRSLAGEDLVLVLGRIDDYDETYINGKLIGSTNQHDKLRVYHFPADLIRPGAVNLLLVYVADYGGNGGIYDGPLGIMKQSQFTRFMRWRD